MRRDHYTYMGHTIHRAGINSSGLRWVCWGCAHYPLRTETLADMRDAIRTTIKGEK